MHLKSNNLNNILGLYLLGCLAFGAALGYFVVKPLINHGQDYSAQTARKNADIAKLKQLGKDTEVLRSNYADVKSKRDLILSQLPLKSEEERLMVLLGSLGQASGVVVSSFSPAGSNVSTSSSLSIYPVAISITGTYEATQAFLQKIEESARFISVGTVSLSSGAQNKTHTVSSSISLQAYYQQQAQLAGGIKK